MDSECSLCVNSELISIQIEQEYFGITVKIAVPKTEG